jgi:hypothetical protein
MFALLSVLFVACEKNVEGSKSPQLKLLSDATVSFTNEGGRGTIEFELLNPEDGVNVEAESSHFWVCGVQVNEGTVDFSVLKNANRENRSATITVSYGETQSFVVEVVQDEAGYDVEFVAEKINGTYFGRVGSDGFNYSVILSDVGVPTNTTLYYGSKSYHFELFSDVSHGFDMGVHELPLGTYTFDSTNAGEPGTFISKTDYTYYAVCDDSGTTDYYGMVAGELVVTENHVEAVIRTEDGLWHHVVYSGDLTLSYDFIDEMVPPFSLITKDYSFDCTGYIHAYYRGDYFGLGTDVWFIDMCETIQPMNGNYIMMLVMVDKSKGGYKEDAFLGTFTAAQIGDTNYVNTFAPGCMQNGFAPYATWMMRAESSMLLNDWGGPLVDGTISISKEGVQYFVTVDCVDDANNKVQGKFACYMDYYLNQDHENPDAPIQPASL